MKLDMSEIENNPSGFPEISARKKIAICIILVGFLVSIYFIYNGKIAHVLSIYAAIMFTFGFILLLIYVISQELFVWLIGKQSEYQKILKVSESITETVTSVLVNNLPANLSEDEKVRLKKSIPEFVKGRLLVNVNAFVAKIFIGAFAAAFGLLGTIVLMKQNDKLEIQNVRITEQTRLMAIQNEKVETQIYLEESNRRSALVFLMSNIMDKIDDELTKREENQKERDLSSQLIGRIVALSQSLEPYRYIKDNKLIEKPLSPERGQLLLSLTKSELSKSTYIKIFKDANFSYSDLSGVTMSGAYLRYAKLDFSNFKGATLPDADVWSASLKGVDFKGAIIKGVNLGESYIDSSIDLEGSRIEVNWKKNIVKQLKNNEDIYTQFSFNKVLSGFDYSRKLLYQTVVLSDDKIDTLKWLSTVTCDSLNVLKNLKGKRFYRDGNLNFISDLATIKFDRNESDSFALNFIVNCNADLVLPDEYPNLKKKWIYKKLYDFIKKSDKFYGISTSENSPPIDYEIRIVGSVENGNLKKVDILNM